MFGKVQEIVVFKHLYKYLMENNLLTSKNSGVKERDSAICQLIQIVDNIYKAIELGKEINMVFLDVPKLLTRCGTKASFINSKAMAFQETSYYGLMTA